jgi:GH25 family lysozyme M1 (1,4-beta-N-acetylmuramidase)
LIGDANKMAAAGVTYNDRGAISTWPAWVRKDAPPAAAPVTFATWQQWQASDQLQSSGLLGPVTLQTNPVAVGL